MKRQELFADVLGVERVYRRNQGMMDFLSGDPHDTLNYPKNHPRQGEPRYTWEPQPDGTLYGYLSPDPPVSEPDAHA